MSENNNDTSNWSKFVAQKINIYPKKYEKILGHQFFE